jgi:hypothetical protein
MPRELHAAEEIRDEVARLINRGRPVRWTCRDPHW